jgi:hypothetical protein
MIDRANSRTTAGSTTDKCGVAVPLLLAQKIREAVHFLTFFCHDIHRPTTTTMAPPPSIDEPLGIPPVPQEPSSTPTATGNHSNDDGNNNDPQSSSRNEEKEVSVGEILYGVESFHAIVQPGKCGAYRMR